MGDVYRGVACFFAGLALVGKPRLRWLALAPMPLTAALFAGAIWGAAHAASGWIDALVAAVPSWLQWLEWLLWLVFAALAGGAILLGFVMVAALVSSPFNGPLAAAAEARLVGRPPESPPWGQTLRALPATLLDEVAKIAYGLLLSLPFLLLFLVPGLNALAPLLWFVCCAWLTAFSFADYALSNHGLRLGDIRRALRARPLLTLGFGCAAFLACSIPLLNLIALPAAVCGGAVLWVRELSGTAPPSMPARRR